MRLHINFIADRQADREAARRLARRGPWLVIGVGLLSLALLWVSSTVATTNARNVRQASEVRERNAGAAEQSRALERELERLAGPHAVAAAVRSNSARWAGLLKEVRDRLPADAWLTGLEIAPARGRTRAERIVLRGQASHPAAIGQYVTGLLGSPWLSGATLVRSGDEKPTAASRGPIAFEIAAGLREPLAPPEEPRR